MKKIFNVIGICALMSYLFIFPSCKESYDEEELLSDIEKKKIELEKEKTFVFAGDSFHLPAKITQIDSSYYFVEPDVVNYVYSFNASNKEAIMHSLFDLTSKLSEYGNFDLNREKKFFRLEVTPLSEAKIEVSNDATHWYFVGSNGRLYNISFDSDSETPNFSIGEFLYRLNEDNTLYIPLPPSIHPIVVSD
ncbi:MAG: hypothetical protein IKQ08_08695 [Paludibacteraceae bacterium]|nr:hypothetical protein [Paludibacteraceae bacterium]